MKISINDFLRNSYVITIDDERYNIFKLLFSKCFYSDIVPKRFDGFVQSDLKSTYKCMLSHVAIVRMAKSMNLPFVVIFEDDAYPCIDIKRKLEKQLEIIPQCNIALLGWNKYDSCNCIDNLWNSLNKWAWGSHAYIVFNCAYDSYIETYDKNPYMVADSFFGFYGNKTIMPKDNLFIQYNITKSMNGYNGYIYNNISNSVPPDGFSCFDKIIENVDDGKQLISEIRNLGRFAYRINGGNAGDFIIASAELQFFDSLNLEYDVITSQNKNCIISNEFNLVYGGGGGWVENYKSGYIKPLNDYFKNKNLKRCVVLPSSFYKCDDVIKSFDERFVVFCRDKKSFEYCIRKNSQAKFYLHDDMAIGLDIRPFLMDDETLSKNICKMKSAYNNTRKYIERGYDIAEFIRTDSERTIGTTNNNYDLSCIYGACGEDISKKDADEITSIMLNTINHYDKIKTNRLHVMISAYLLKKNIIAYDNSYGKLSAVYDMSLSKNGNITMNRNVTICDSPSNIEYASVSKATPLPKSEYNNPYFMGAFKP